MRFDGQQWNLSVQQYFKRSYFDEVVSELVNTYISARKAFSSYARLWAIFSLLINLLGFQQ